MKKPVKQTLIVIVILITLYLVLNNQKIFKSSFGDVTKWFTVDFLYNVPLYIKNSTDARYSEIYFADFNVTVPKGKSVYLRDIIPTDGMNYEYTYNSWFYSNRTGEIAPEKGVLNFATDINRPLNFLKKNYSRIGAPATSIELLSGITKAELQIIYYGERYILSIYGWIRHTDTGPFNKKHRDTNEEILTQWFLEPGWVAV